MTCGPCAFDQHEKCTGLLRASFGFCACADHDHTITIPELPELPPAPSCQWCGGVDCLSDCCQKYEAMDDAIYDEEV